MDIVENNNDILRVVVDYNFIKDTEANWKVSIKDVYRKRKLREDLDTDEPLMDVSIGLSFTYSQSVAYLDVYYSFTDRSPYKTNKVFGQKMDWKVKRLLGWDFFKEHIHPEWNRNGS